jgi:hypothetical protein
VKPVTTRLVVGELPYGLALVDGELVEYSQNVEGVLFRPLSFVNVHHKLARIRTFVQDVGCKGIGGEFGPPTQASTAQMEAAGSHADLTPDHMF